MADFDLHAFASFTFSFFPLAIALQAIYFLLFSIPVVF